MDSITFRESVDALAQSPQTNSTHIAALKSLYVAIDREYLQNKLRGNQHEIAQETLKRAEILLCIACKDDPAVQTYLHVQKYPKQKRHFFVRLWWALTTPEGETVTRLDSVLGVLDKLSRKTNAGTVYKKLLKYTHGEAFLSYSPLPSEKGYDYVERMKTHIIQCMFGMRLNEHYVLAFLNEEPFLKKHMNTHCCCPMCTIVQMHEMGSEHIISLSLALPLSTHHSCFGCKECAFVPGPLENCMDIQSNATENCWKPTNRKTTIIAKSDVENCGFRVIDMSVLGLYGYWYNNMLETHLSLLNMCSHPPGLKEARVPLLKIESEFIELLRLTLKAHPDIRLGESGEHDHIRRFIFSYDIKWWLREVYDTSEELFNSVFLRDCAGSAVNTAVMTVRADTI